MRSLRTGGCREFALWRFFRSLHKVERITLLMTKTFWTLILAVMAVHLGAQTEASYLRPILEDEILAPQVAVFQLRQYILRRVAKPPAPCE
jgi:hypothetical protein